MENRQSLHKWGQENWTAACKRVELEHSLEAHKINSSQIKDINVSLDTVKLRLKHRQSTLGNKPQQDLFDSPTRVMKIKTKLNKWDLIKLENL